VLSLLLVVASCWLGPVDAPVADPFRPPPCRWCPGNRGLEYATDAGVGVRSVASGRVVFAGRVAGTGYVTVEVADPDGDGVVRVTYGGVTTTLGAGDPVLAGTRIATTEGRLHLGVRREGVYVDPAPLIGRLQWPVRLVPVDASPARPAAPTGSICWPDRPVRLTDTTRSPRLRSP
jgi:murein DD-endopeptidase MepM/ murein hydrolase activator NlpD